MREPLSVRPIVKPETAAETPDKPLPLQPGTSRAQALAAARRDFEKARLALDMGKPRLAVTLTESCLAIEADHPEYLGLWGYAQSLIGGNLRTALKACEQAVADRSNDATLHAHLGCVLQACGRENEARPCFEKALQEDPQHTLAKTQLQSLSKGAKRFSIRSLLRRLQR